MNNVETWKIKMQNSDSYVITEAERLKLEKFISTRGTQHPRWQMNDLTYLFISQISSMEPLTYRELKPEDPAPKDKTEQEIKPEQSKQEEMLNKLMELSQCTHENKSLYYKKTKKGMRYFPVCDKCFRPSRFVKSSSLTEEEKNSAKEWVES